MSGFLPSVRPSHAESALRGCLASPSATTGADLERESPWESKKMASRSVVVEIPVRALLAEKTDEEAELSEIEGDARLDR